MTRIVFILSIYLLCFARPIVVPAQEKPIKVYGSYMNMKTNGEHASGYSVDLWAQGKKMIGIIRVHRGLMGDPPAGLLEDVLFDPQTHAFSFTARTSLGLFPDQTHSNEPSQDVLTFKGTLTKRRLSGTLVLINRLCKDR